MPPKKKSIPKALKNLVWDKNIGKEKGIGECYVCKQELDSKKFHCGHIIAEKSGGETQLDNLKPICATCNLSMGTQNMEDFKKMFFTEKIKDKKMCYFELLHEFITSRKKNFDKTQTSGNRNLLRQRQCNNTVYNCLVKQNYKDYDLQNLLERTKPQFINICGKMGSTIPDDISLTFNIYDCMRLAKNKEYICDNCIAFLNLLL